jgi:hypothetical protein
VSTQDRARTRPSIVVQHRERPPDHRFPSEASAPRAPSVPHRIGSARRVCPPCSLPTCYLGTCPLPRAARINCCCGRQNPLSTKKKTLLFSCAHQHSVHFVPHGLDRWNSIVLDFSSFVLCGLSNAVSPSRDIDRPFSVYTQSIPTSVRPQWPLRRNPRRLSSPCESWATYIPRGAVPEDVRFGVVSSGGKD